MITDIFNEEVVLEDERVLMRPLQSDDGEHFRYFSINEPDLWKYGQVTAAGEENLYNYFNQAADNRASKKRIPLRRI